ncbi:S8 family peptidase [Streptomyces virginiae]|uniref:S8 family peptidase n=1 Tax=Streptomyces virginiae TaxID=1961 RepID=UPI002DB573FC|nr:S8 family serine peptidase [Streptomyces sp. CMAA1738]MEC4570236.1 S8 family serine peptidase [Streptomyces sp. CMAA1738]
MSFHFPCLSYRSLCVAVAGATVITAVTVAVGPAEAGPSNGRVRSAAEPIPGRYLVVFKEAPASASAQSRPARAAEQETAAASAASAAARTARTHGGAVRSVFSSALRGYAAEMTEAQAARVAADPAVAYVQQDGLHAVSATQSDPPWGLDRIDQRDLPTDKKYTAGETASNVTVYLVDSGLRTTHAQFGGRATIGVDKVGDGRNGADCTGHGTHVAGTVGGKDFGVAKGARLVSVRVTDCRDRAATSAIIAAADWITANAVKPAVVNMSINGGGNTAEDDAIKRSIASGVTWVVSSGNGGTDACKNSPARISAAIVVNNSTSDDGRRSDSNFGSCTDLFAPGTGVISAGHKSDTASRQLSGTSMAAPHVAGAAALYLSKHPAATPAEVQSALIGAATPGKVRDAGRGTPNRLLFTGGS